MPTSFSSLLQLDSNSAGTEVSGDQLTCKRKVLAVGNAPARSAGSPGSNPGQGENFSLKIKITNQEISDFTF